MKHLRKVTLLLCALMLLTTLTACSNSSNASGDDGNTAPDTSQNSTEPVTLKYNAAMGEDHMSTILSKEIADEVFEATDGAVQIDVYPSSALGEMNLVVQSLIEGTVDMCCGAVDATFVPFGDILTIGYLVSDYNQSKYMLSPGSNTFGNVAKAFDDIGIELVAIYSDGLCGVSTKKVPTNYNVPGAAKDVLMRVTLSDTIQAVIQGMGYTTVSIVWADVFSSIQTGVCDGSAGQVAGTVYQSLRDVVDYYIPYAYVPEVLEFMISLAVYDKITPEQLEIIRSTILEKAEWMFDNAEAEEGINREKLAEAGVETLPLTPEEITAFAENEHELNWSGLEERFGQEAIDGIYADYENC